MPEMMIALPEWERIPDIGLYMDQVLTLTERIFSRALPDGEITRSMVNNYVKSGLIPRPVGKKYDREHLALLIMIGLLKQALSMECIARLLSLVCADGVEQGYARFVHEVRRQEETGADGGSFCGGQDEALSISVSAALYTVRAQRLLAAQQG
ncbi:MAG: DUF1836 domain-containing protein [Clostridia bacterium]|nr:DUF1836 domain-containing protein [Clostridia bacterium]